jgi:hypothetical protein
MLETHKSLLQGTTMTELTWLSIAILMSITAPFVAIHALIGFNIVFDVIKEKIKEMNTTHS